jgi:hypothetical protein
VDKIISESHPMPSANTYTDLVLRLRAWDDDHYPVEATTDDGSHYEGELRLGRDSLLALELDSPAYGKALYDALFAGDIRRAYDKATARAEALNENRLRVQLWIDNDAVELHAFPWERIYHPSRSVMVPLATSSQTPFSRYTSLETAQPAPVSERPIRVLAVAANPLNLPGGLAPADVEGEIENLRQAFGDIKKSEKVQVSILSGRTGLKPETAARLQAEGYTLLDGVTSLENILRHLPGQHIFHFIGHGAFRRASDHGPGQAALYLEKPDGTWQAVKDDDIVGRLAAVGDLPHLTFLVACESASRDTAAEHPFVGLGPKLVQAGVPAVVAMQAQVPVDLARNLSGEFYKRLLEHGEVDQALSQARLVVFNPKQTEWAIPVLFMRLKEGRLFAEPKDEKPEGGSSIVIKSGGDLNLGSFVGGNSITSFQTTTNTIGDDSVINKVLGDTGGKVQLTLLIQQFVMVEQAITALTDKDKDEKDELKDTAKRIRDEVKKGNGANAGKVERWLNTIAGMSNGVLQLTVAALINPAVGVSKAVRDVARKVQEEA